MTHVHRWATLTELWHGEIERQLFATEKDIDRVTGSDTIRYDCLFSCDSMRFDFNSGRDLFLMKQRFTVLQNAYLELDNLERFLSRCSDIGNKEWRRGVVTQLFARQHENAPRKYRWGNCMLGWDFRGGGNTQPILTMHSRVSYIAYIGGLDLALCYVLAREIGSLIDRAPEEFGFRWYLSSCQFHYFKSLPCLYALGYEEFLVESKHYPSDKYPTLRGLRKDHARVLNQEADGKSLADEKFAQRRRIRRRWQEHLAGKDYSAPLASLNFDPLRRNA